VEPNRGGRPSRLTTQRIETLSNLIRKGATAEAAAGAVGISPSTYYAWMRTGRSIDDCRSASEHERLCRDLVAAMSRAEAELQQELVAELMALAKPHPVCTITTTRTPYRNGNNVVMNAEGEPVMIETTVTRETQVRDSRAAEVLLKRADRNVAATIEKIDKAPPQPVIDLPPLTGFGWSA
jgi:hypothetical protein